MGGVLARLRSTPVADSVKLRTTAPKDDTRETFVEVQDFLGDSDYMLTLIKEYKECSGFAREALSKPNPDNERTAFMQHMDSINAIYEIYQHSERLKQLSGKLMGEIHRSVQETKDGQGNIKQFDENYVYQMCLLLQFAVEFDHAKMLQFKLMNDFAFYKRLLPRMGDVEKIVGPDEASSMGSFTAQNKAMLQAIGHGTKGQNQEILSMLFPIIANSCMTLLSTTDSTDQELFDVFSRVCVASMIVYDDVLLGEGFGKKTPLAVKAIIKMLQSNQNITQETRQFCLNNIKFSARGFKDSKFAALLE